MQSPASPPPSQSSDASGRAEALRRLSSETRDSLQKFEKDGDIAALDQVMLAILDDYIPRQPPQPLATYAGTTRLIEDLGFDSLAVTEVVFFTEDLFSIRIANEEIIQVKTLDDLRGFVQRKVSERQTAA